MSEKTGYKYKVSTSQSVSSGIIAVSVDFYFDNLAEFLKNGPADMVDVTQSVEDEFKLSGYKIAKDIVPKETKSKKEEAQ